MISASSRAARRSRYVAATALAALLSTSAACGSNEADVQASDGMPAKVTIAYQPGLSYAPLILLKQNGTLEKEFPNTTFEWTELSSSAAVQDGMISGDIQVGAGSAAQMILARDKGVDWRYLASLNDAELWLMAKDERLTSLSDFTSSDKIAMPSLTSIQALVLRKGAQDQLGDAEALDTNIVPMSHPDGLQNLVSGQIAAHLTSPPFQFDEQDQGMRVVLKSSDLFGPIMFNGVFMMNEYYEQNTEFSTRLYSILEEQIAALADDPAAAAAELSANSGGKTTPESFEKYLTNPAITYTTEPHGLQDIAGFMEEIGMISETPDSWKDLTFPTVHESAGS